MTLCECGCGGEARPGRRYIKNHYQMMRKAQRAAKLQSSSAGNFSQSLCLSRPGTPDTSQSSSMTQTGAGQRNEATSDPAPVSNTDLQTEIKRLHSQVNRLAFGLFVSLILNAVLLVIQVFPEVLK